MQFAFPVGRVPIYLDLHEFSDANASDLRHPKVPHGVTHSSSLRIKNSLLRFDDDVDLHVPNIVAGSPATSTNQLRAFAR